VGIVDENTIMVDVGIGGEGLVGLDVKLLLHLGEIYRLPLEGVVELLGDGEEVRVPVKKAPARINPYIVHQGDEAVEDLSNPTTDTGGVDMEDMHSIKAPRPPVDIRYYLLPYNIPIILQGSHLSLLLNNT